MELSDLMFWTGILSDHAEFQIHAFSYDEGAYIQEAERFYSVFHQYNMEFQSRNYADDLEELRKEVVKFINFKKNIIIDLLRCNVKINFSPSFINHMVNEASEFLSLLCNGDSCPVKTQTPATYIKTWMADASGHTSSMIASLDPAETFLLKNTEYFKSRFDGLYKKSSELEMIQNNMNDMSFVGLLKTEAISTLKEFIEFCEDLISLLNACIVMSTGTFDSKIVNHFIREHNYVISKITSCIS